jgi:hypothetical protein
VSSIPRLVCVLLCALATLAGSPMARATPAKVLVVGEPGASLVSRLRAELLALGLRVELSDSDEDPRSLVASRKADALVGTQNSPPRVHLWLKRGEHVESIGELDSETAGEAGERVLVLRAVEMLRAQLIPVEAPTVVLSPASEASSENTAAAPAPIEAPLTSAEPVGPSSAAPPTPSLGSSPTDAAAVRASSDTKPRFAFTLGGGLLAMPGGLPPAAQLRLGATWPLADRLALEAQLVAPTSGARVVEPEGSIDVHMLAAAIGPSLWLSDPRADLAAAAHLGLGSAALFHTADAPPPNRGSSGAAPLFASYFGLSARYHAASWIAARADADLWLLAPSYAFRTVGRESASVGPLAMVLALGVEVSP